jgi:hypothetical protein
MAINASATFNNRANYTVTESYAGISTTDADSQTLTTSYTHGTGDLQINAGVSISGTLSSGEHKILDLYNNASKPTGILTVEFGVTGGVPINVVKHISVFNTSTVKGYDIEVNNTGLAGVYGLLGLLGDNATKTGVQVIRPYSSFSFNNPYGAVTDSFGNITNESKYIGITDIAGSGASFKVLVMGVDTSQPTGGVPANPYG